MAKKAQIVSRRSFVGLITGAAAATVISTPVVAQQANTGRTDSDPNDRAGYGRTGITDSDSNDRAGYGRGSSGITDSDTGSNRDCAGRGRGSTTGNTDSDSGGGADQGGNGRTGSTDSDSADRAGYGRGRGSCAG